MKFFTFTSAVILSAAAAQADTLTLDAPLAGGTLHNHNADMSVYWTDSNDASEVVAHYIPTDGTTDGGVLRMRLAEGDSVNFGLPGIADTSYRFERTAQKVTITSSDLAVQQALVD